ncbi:MAG: hypothetical protein A2836_03075 [Candidatus Taylorbacteria bacterium RIFCSPHIGHO2_01_FULL_45_63]|uniref:Uncharacterized protein n=1 Tax=Candidatus Taylorbacteria bacterium RIFCSPHIGHO2_02_FULL_45_35 TaxID=1802311 RepID=A0A1G2MUY8_9BACT|nr:MAG: hypothetical protein A2836_03075 [Candidatus Taylorbacteria bacterium RIFCSPHIGHO2_01_FULL_45_63]OHA27675.1 MAG: hypothetical protein A3D56_02175 [Candidatus Taylorbacteria bacterium RIFCSPHIGHO2_02_FULL_45_35]OHA32524.1 MAG: hypothetical protein A3A22_03240 [Candidatus Taylorbacteria bacterium RIFCSPLOWO2_01_FULL_45_34b]
MARFNLANSEIPERKKVWQHQHQAEELRQHLYQDPEHRLPRLLHLQHPPPLHQQEVEERHQPLNANQSA